MALSLTRSNRSHEKIFFRRLILLLVGVGLQSSSALASSLPGYDRSNPLDNAIDLPRASAMGSAFVGVSDDASALFSNPSGLGFLDQGQVFLNSDFWLVGTFQESAVVGLPISPGEGVGLAVHYLDYGSFEGRDTSGIPTKPYGANRWGIQGGWGMEVLKDLAFGIGLGDSQTTLAGVTNNHLYSDLGLLLRMDPGLRFGVSYLNGGLSTAGTSSEDAIDLGASYATDLDPNTHLLASIGTSFEPQGPQYFQIGAEMMVEQRLFLRAGFQTALTDMGLIGLSDLTAGVGLRFSDMSLDYAFLPYGELGTVHQISLGYQFGASDRPAPLRKKAPALTAQPSPSPTPSPGTVQPREVQGPQDKDSLIVQFEDPDAATDPSNAADLGSLDKVKTALAAVKADPQSAFAWYSLGNAYREIKQREYAVKCYESVLKLQPGNKKLSEWLEKYKREKP